MKNCEECNKKLSFLEGYQHPTLGKKVQVCGNCFDTVTASVEKWAEFVVSNPLPSDSYRDRSVRNISLPAFYRKPCEQPKAV